MYLGTYVSVEWAVTNIECTIHCKFTTITQALSIPHDSLKDQQAEMTEEMDDEVAGN
jgi:hypothetical protein